jgi:two-component system sensor histidine kinase DegS
MTVDFPAQRTGCGLNSKAMRLTTLSEELDAIAAEARRELASAEARLDALFEHGRELCGKAAKEQAEFGRLLAQFGLEPVIYGNAAQVIDNPGDPLFDLEAMRSSADELRADVDRSGALEANIAIALHMVQDACAVLAPDRAFSKVLESNDLRLQQAMNSAREDERRRLAREIHDGPAQVLSNAVFWVDTTAQVAKRAPDQVAEELAQLRQLLKDGVSEIRRFMFDLRPTMLQDLGLAPTLARYVDDYSRFFGKRVRLDSVETLPPLTADQELTIFRIVQEALQNVHKHAGLTAEVDVNLTVVGPILTLIIRDNGRGFEPRAVAPRSTSGAGLPGMRERANLVGAELTVDSAPGNGTTILLRMPLRGQTGPLGR